MSQTPLDALVLLGATHRVSEFDCGSEALNLYLKRFAYSNNQNGSARTYVALKKNEVVGYYSLAPGSVTKEDAHPRVGQGLARHPVPIILLARLAVDRKEKSKGIGRELLRDALIRVVNAADSIGGRALLVHAKDELSKSFYEHYGFESSPFDAFHLYLLLKDIRKTFGI